MDKQFRLPKEFAEKWLTALRSGKYKQAVETLYDPDVDGFCCLGVACVLEYPLHYLKTETGRFGGVIEKSFKQLKFNLKKIPNELKGSAVDNDLVGELTSINDGGYSFIDIANWIENNVELY
jgi:hypothetical protein